MSVAGTLALVGGGEWRKGCDFDPELLDEAGTDEVLIVPTAAAYEYPGRVTEAAKVWFDELGARVRTLPVLQRTDADVESNIRMVREARFIYLSDGSPLHLRSVLKNSLLWDALVAVWHEGATIAGSSAGAMVLGDPMVDPRGGAFTLGLGLIRKLAIVPHWETWSGERIRRMTHLLPAEAIVAEVEERTALIRSGDGSWVQRGDGAVTCTLGGAPKTVEEIEAVIDVSRP